MMCESRGGGPEVSLPIDSRLILGVVGFRRRRLIEPVESELLSHGGPVQTEPLGGGPTIALQAAHDFFKERRLDATEQLEVQIGRRAGGALARSFRQP